MKKLWLNKSDKSLLANKAASPSITKTITTTTNVLSVTTTTGSSTPAPQSKAAITTGAILPLKAARSPPVAAVPLKATITSPIAVPLKAAIVIKNVTPTYIQRKTMQPMFQELFAALFKIPDKALHQRVLDAINGDPCRQCKERAARQFSDADSQTDAKEKLNDAETQTEVINSTIAEELGLAGLNLPTEPPNVPKRRKRKRKLCLPRVVKQSHAEQLREHQKSYSAQPTKRKKIAVVEPKLEPPATPPPLDMEDSKEDSWSLNNFPFLDDVLALPDFVEEDQNKTSQLDYVINTMLKEFLMAERYENGLLPIHDAIISNNTMQLQRQIYVWGKKKCDLNELLTETGDDCLQLAVINDCLPEIYEILLNKQLDINVIDDQSNNIIHLAMSSEICLESLEILLKKIDPQLLLQHNDDGYTPLHIAVRQDLYQHAELLLNMLDKRLSNKLIYPRQQSDDCKREEFCYYYEHACSELGVGGQSHKPSPLKMKLLNAGDMRGGNTALFYCVENKLDHMAFLLLAHLADPGILNYSSQSAKIYFNDFGKLFELSLKVDNAMDKVK